MLESLHIQNYALIDDIELEFGPGFNVLTGETGAGKSIIVGALNLVLGARASAEGVRDGADRARVDAVFRIGAPARDLAAALQESDIALEDGVLILSRVVTPDGRSRAYAGGVPVPLAVLAAIGDELVDLHGQHEHQSLLKPARQLDLLDGFAGAQQAAGAVAAAVSALRDVERDLAALEVDDRERARRVEFLQHEVREIETAGLHPGEEEESRERRDLLTNAERIFELSSRAYATLHERDEGAVVDALDAASGDVEELARINNRFTSLAERLAEAREKIEDVAAELREFTTEIEFDPQELEDINARLTLISALKRKYGESIAAVLAYGERAREEVAAFEQRDERLAQLKRQRGALFEEGRRLAGELSEQRKKAARALDKQIAAALAELGMKGGRFETRFECGELCATGIDRVEFLLAANPGEPLKPLRHVASGGEISRVMLALKSVFAKADTIPTLIFDEIDAGVGGAVANKVAAKLAELAGSHQTICISHLPQIAAAAQTHFHVAKETQKKRTVTSVARIADEDRVRELARLLDGSVSAVSIEHARSLLAPQAK
ncbi:MAG TPA: DNA repair protein RecN [Candidatus Hydrogenedentes bacterium]|nr:DNA repair protein RecN [Candidatus Hydrogenedentota bacterium]HPA02982.1 DNA repair protein RecN [Candidatus Hydrogenedentota bacterium]HPV38961.1 DNA repair protein RecN [Candidatus Hydrogenedentota bacterium]HQE75004.1 DNA repair protein RecN [Candidatus Hydrogenedentota bacterium]HQK74847.1 DNA repair protein RecN [Candidatus Hydrogenedentota bacterium]